MKDEQRIKVLEDELKVLKNEIKAVLLDLREQYLNLQNPFNCNMTSGTGHGIRESKLELQEYGAETDEQDDLVNETNAGTMIPEVKTRDSQVNSPASFVGVAKGGKQMSLPKTPGEAAGLPFRDNERMEESSRADWNGAGHLWHQLTGQNKEQLDDEQPTDITAHLFKRSSSEQDFAPNHGKVDLVVIAGLTQWVDQATSKLGRERTEIIVEMSYAMGHLPEKLKDAVIRMVRLSPNESKSQKMAASDYLELLAQLENLLGNSRQQEKALLSIISMMKDSKDG